MENTNIINAAIKGGNIPRNWLYCFNSGCQHHEECIRFTPVRDNRVSYTI